MYVCRRLRVLNFLIERGFKYVSEREDRKNPNFKVWLFVETPELRNTIEEYYSIINKKD